MKTMPITMTMTIIMPMMIMIMNQPTVISPTIFNYFSFFVVVVLLATVNLEEQNPQISHTWTSCLLPLLGSVECSIVWYGYWC